MANDLGFFSVLKTVANRGQGRALIGNIIMGLPITAHNFPYSHLGGKHGINYLYFFNCDDHLLNIIQQ
jgi:hypothetical protein